MYLRRAIVLPFLVALLFSLVPMAYSPSSLAETEANLLLEMQVSETKVILGEEINITLTVRNVGNTTFNKTYSSTPAPIFHAYFLTPSGLFLDNYGGVYLPVIVEFTLNPGDNFTTTLEWDLYRREDGTHAYPPVPGTYDLYGWCDLTSIPIFMPNPTFVPITIVGDWWNLADLNFNYEVDIYDIVLCANAYGSTPPDSHWDPLCDLAEPYGTIDIFDIIIIAISYGEQYTS